MTPIEEEEVRAFLILNRLRIEGRRRALTLLSEGKSAREIVERMESEDLLKELPVSGNEPSFPSEEKLLKTARERLGISGAAGKVAVVREIKA